MEKTPVGEIKAGVNKVNGEIKCKEEDESDKDHGKEGEDGAVSPALSQLSTPHFDGRHLVDLLLGMDDDYEASEASPTGHVAGSGARDCLVAWQDTVDSPRTQLPRQTRPSLLLQGQSQEGSTRMSLGGVKDQQDYSHHVAPDFPALPRHLRAHNVPYERDFVDVPAWKICVEPTTYRYVPNNGRYRATKLARRLEIQRCVRKTTDKLNPEQKHLQREIQRELRREFDVFMQYQKEKSEETKRKSKERREERKPKPIDKPPKKSQSFNEFYVLDVRDNEDNDDSHCDDVTHSRERASSASDAQQSSDSGRVRHSPNYESRDVTRTRDNVDSSPIELPPICVPLMTQPSSSNDQILSTFRQRLNVLDRELRRDGHLVRRNGPPQHPVNEVLFNQNVDLLVTNGSRTCERSPCSDSDEGEESSGGARRKHLNRGSKSELNSIANSHPQGNPPSAGNSDVPSMPTRESPVHLEPKPETLKQNTFCITKLGPTSPEHAERRPHPAGRSVDTVTDRYPDRGRRSIDTVTDRYPDRGEEEARDCHRGYRNPSRDVTESEPPMIGSLINDCAEDDVSKLASVENRLSHLHASSDPSTHHGPPGRAGIPRNSRIDGLWKSGGTKVGGSKGKKLSSPNAQSLSKARQTRKEQQATLSPESLLPEIAGKRVGLSVTSHRVV